LFYPYGAGLQSVSDNVIRNNVLYNNGFDDGTRNITQNVVILASGDNNLFYNNLVYNNPTLKKGAAVAIAYVGAAGNNQILHNTIYGNAGAAVETHPQSGYNSVIKNNIFYNNAGGTLVDNGAAGLDAKHNVTSDPRFTNVPAADFSLQAESAALQAGGILPVVETDIVGHSRRGRAAADVGAYAAGSSGMPGRQASRPAPWTLRLTAR
jgi:Right handed beta helix region